LGELRRMFPEASKKMLTQISARWKRTAPRHSAGSKWQVKHVEYSLIDSMGFAVLHLIKTLTKWGREYLTCEANTPE
jgi:hypothetical protein